ncbi:MAG: hypothetical protein GXP55_14535 [Deltaproteobacteria bacterium]|nr:hypothetical protein [Deltaproteobacteria bacterium]
MTIHPVSAPLTGATIELESTQPRVTSRPASTRFRDSLENGANVVLSGVESAAGFIPGGSSVSAAIRSARQSTGGGGEAEAPGSAAAGLSQSGSGLDLTSQVRNDTMELLQLQQNIAMEQRRYMITSNVMKARHDTAKQVVNNVR